LAASTSSARTRLQETLRLLSAKPMAAREGRPPRDGVPPLLPSSLGESTVDPELADMRAAIEAWVGASGTRPKTVETVARKLRGMAEGFDPFDRERMLKEFRDLSLAVVSVAQQQGHYEQRVALAELKRLVSIAGLSLLEPRVGEPFDLAVHEMTGRDPARSNQERQRLAKVESLGLLDRNTVLAKAGVRIYD
jgi:hypothetical protein